MGSFGSNITYASYLENSPWMQNLMKLKFLLVILPISKVAKQNSKIIHKYDPKCKKMQKFEEKNATPFLLGLHGHFCYCLLSRRST